MLINVPIESLEERYSAQWNVWFPNEFSRLGIQYTTIAPDNLGVPASIKHGQFLDVFGTLKYKAWQMAELAELIEAGGVTDGDVIFFHDLWFPGLESLFYMRSATGIDFKIAGILHAGTYDPNDYLAQKGMSIWATELENAWFNEVDVIFVATQYHKRMLLRNRNFKSSDSIVVTGLPIYPPVFYGALRNKDREDIVVFPHRLAVEKRPEVFTQLAGVLKSQFPKWSFLKAKDVCKSKADYYELLSRSKIAVSCAVQETFGIAQQEAVFCGCLPVVPDRAAYKELYPKRFRYTASATEFGNHFNYLVDAVTAVIVNRDEIVCSSEYSGLVSSLLQNGQTAIQKMMQHLNLT